MSEHAPDDAPAAGAWWRLVELFFAQHSKHHQVVRSLGLNPPHAMALMQLDPERPAPMRVLAGILSCDASHVTGLVDRLEELGYVERRNDPTDRRVKTLVLTAEGERARQVARAGLYEPPAELLALSDSDQRLLRDIAARATGTEGDLDEPAAPMTWRSDPLAGARPT